MTDTWWNLWPKVLCSLGVKRGLVAYGQEKLDEISPNGPTTICELKDGIIGPASSDRKTSA